MEKLGYVAMEEQILLLLDNELTPEQSDTVWEQIEAFSEYRALYEEYAVVYFGNEDIVQAPDFSYLKKMEQEEVAVLMRPRKTSKPIWGIAASVAILLTLSALLWSDRSQELTEHRITKSDKVHQLTESPIKMLQEDSLNRRQEALRSKESRPSKDRSSVRAGNGSSLAVLHEEVIEKKERNITTDLASGLSGGLQLIDVSIPELEEKYVAAAAIADNMRPLSDRTPGNYDPRGLLPEMIKAGQWIFGDHKQSTTVEFAIGNNENRKLKIKL